MMRAPLRPSLSCYTWLCVCACIYLLETQARSYFYEPLLPSLLGAVFCIKARGQYTKTDDFHISKSGRRKNTARGITSHVANNPQLTESVCALIQGRGNNSSSGSRNAFLSLGRSSGPFVHWRTIRYPGPNLLASPTLLNLFSIMCVKKRAGECWATGRGVQEEWVEARKSGWNAASRD